jgi:hypothetical protein
MPIPERDHDLRDKEKIMALAEASARVNWQKHNKANGLGPRTVIVKIEKTNLTYDDLNAIAFYLTQASGVAGSLAANQADAFTIAALVSDEAGGEFVSGTSDSVTLALQGTGVVTKAGLETLDAVTTATILADFDQRVIPA